MGGWPNRLGSGSKWEEMRRIIALCALALAAAACGGGGSGAPQGPKLEDAEFRAFVDRDGDGLSFNDGPSQTRFSEWLAGSKPGTKILMINAAAGWCNPCMLEAQVMNAFAADYKDRGVIVVTTVFQNGRGDPADDEFTRLWAESFALSIPTFIDSAFTMDHYLDANTMPSNMFVDAVTSEILGIQVGASAGDDPMKDYRELLDQYLAR